ncbi:hypothetical protein SEMRO_406_G136340.1 [Seminavis robusta]|uniref:Uncharacterized protein n=1 Tax=Seminavis robusta TaxID=568900 RepID=A0A9N8DWW2_9STRA|nr:hypothetical protein SEMRO_406_G136340.1 [Seminavis robusta]|eukprot:Sro406_g136340.1 n/a (220) ;mRNA; f:10398-11160
MNPSNEIYSGDAQSRIGESTRDVDYQPDPHLQEEQGDLKKANYTAPNQNPVQLATDLSETASMEFLAKNAHEAKVTDTAPPGNTHQQGEMITPSKQVTRTRPGIDNLAQASMPDEHTEGNFRLSDNRTTNNADYAFTELASMEARLSDTQHSGLLSTFPKEQKRQTAGAPGMPAKGLQGNTGLTALGAHHIEPSADVGGARPVLRGLGKNRPATKVAKQ